MKSPDTIEHVLRAPLTWKVGDEMVISDGLSETHATVIKLSNELNEQKQKVVRVTYQLIESADAEDLAQGQS